jgi:hypothetical protein
MGKEYSMVVNVCGWVVCGGGGGGGAEMGSASRAGLSQTSLA